MKTISLNSPSAAAALVAALVLFSSIGFGWRLQSVTARHSGQTPIPDDWFERSSSPSPEKVAQGRKLYLNSCAHCHGIDATGDEGPDLHDVQVSDRYIINTIKRGIPHEMPSFSKKLNSNDLSALLAYVRTLAASP